MPETRGFKLPRLRALFGRRFPLIGPDVGHSIAERQFRAVGFTAEGRSLFVVFTMETEDVGDAPLIRPVSARYMHKKEVDAHEKKYPEFKTDKEAEDFVATADLSEYELFFGHLVPMRFELRRKDKSISLRLPERLLDEVRRRMPNEPGCLISASSAWRLSRALHNSK